MKIRSLRFLPLSSVTFFCLLILSAPLRPTCAQDAEVTVSPAAAVAETAEHPEAMDVVSDPVDLAAVPSTADSGFWFLTTQNSPQSFTHTCPRFCPAVSRYDECQGMSGSSYQEMLAGLEPGVPVCIVIHGSFVDTPSACRESGHVWRWVKSASRGHRMQMIYFSWPSFRRITPLVQIDANILGRRAARNGYYLAELIHHLPPTCPVCLIGHSHGTRVVSGGLHLLAGGAIQGICHPYARVNGRPIRTVFSASAIDHNWLNPGNRYGRALCSTQCLLNMVNCSDPALQVYALRMPLISKRALGLTGLSSIDRNHLGYRASQVLDYDVSRAVGRNHLWPYYFTNRSLAMLMHNYVYFPRYTPAAATIESAADNAKLPSSVVAQNEDVPRD